MVEFTAALSPPAVLPRHARDPAAVGLAQQVLQQGTE